MPATATRRAARKQYRIVVTLDRLADEIEGIESDFSQVADGFYNKLGEFIANIQSDYPEFEITAAPPR